MFQRSPTTTLRFRPAIFARSEDGIRSESGNAQRSASLQKNGEHCLYDDQRRPVMIDRLTVCLFHPLTPSAGAAAFIAVMHSHHSHSGAFCCHAASQTSPSSMLSIAQARGFTHYNLTEHIPRAHIDHLYPEERQANITTDDLLRTFQAYLVEARRCAVAFAADKHWPVKVLVGAELENVDGRTAECLEFVESILKDDAQQWIVEYVVGSVHHVHGIPIDFDKPMFERTLVHMLSTTEGRLHSEVLLLHDSDRRRAHLLLMLAYLDAQYALLQHFKPEVIGHFDLCRLFQPDTPMTLAGKSAVQSNLHDLLRQVGAMVKRNVAFAAAYGALFEINSASMRKGWQTPYPGEDVLDVSLQTSKRIFALTALTHLLSSGDPG